MKTVIGNLFIALMTILASCGQESSTEMIPVIAGNGKMPAATVDGKGNLNIVYGTGDSIMYVFSSDGAVSFSSPVLVAVLPGLSAANMRGPQIAATEGGISIIACNKEGNIFSYRKEGEGAWSGATKVNDVDTVAKEGLMALHADKNNVYAVWLDLRHGNNEIIGSASVDGGKTWTANKLVYASPDTTVCECCKPSVFVKGKHIAVMFRNQLYGNRDLYLVQSDDGGVNFGQASKVGAGNWVLDGCPMDGGGLAVNEQNNILTVWRRHNTIYSCEPGKQEVEIGEGKNCTLTVMGNRPVYAWMAKDDIVCLLPEGKRKIISKGGAPVIKALSENKIACIWENENKIYAEVVNL